MILISQSIYSMFTAYLFSALASFSYWSTSHIKVLLMCFFFRTVFFSPCGFFSQPSVAYVYEAEVLSLLQLTFYHNSSLYLKKKTSRHQKLFFIPVPQNISKTQPFKLVLKKITLMHNLLSFGKLNFSSHKGQTVQNGNCL